LINNPTPGNGSPNICTPTEIPQAAVSAQMFPVHVRRVASAE